MACLDPKMVKVYKRIGDDKTKVFFKSPSIDDPLPISGVSSEDWLLADGCRYRLDGVYRVPCGNCAGCALDRSKIWSNRLLAESKTNAFSYFLTLTYDDLHNPGQLIKNDLKEFIKKLRRYMYEKYKIVEIRYFAVGEYGGKTLRPHYHLILFGCPFTQEDFNFLGIGASPKRKVIGKSEYDTQKAYSYDLIEKLWPYGFNFVVVANSNCFGYVSRYCNKKQTRSREEKQAIAYYGIQPEFQIQSTRPGIGERFILANIDKLITNQGTIFIDGRSVTFGRYLYKVLERYRPASSEPIKEKRIAQANLYVSRCTQLGTKRSDYYKCLEYETNVRKENLKRNL